MKRLALLMLAGSTLMGCVDDGYVRVEAAPPPPPQPVVVSATVSTDVPAPPTGRVEAPAPPVVEATDDPEEVTAVTEPPDPLYEEPDDMPGPGYVWIGGYWGWTGADWAWSPGHYMVAPAGRVYVAPYYERVNGQVVFVRGFWGPPGYAYRTYGGDRITFEAVPRPVGWHRGYYDNYHSMPGERPGARPARFYAHASGTFRPVPRATAPYRAAPAPAPMRDRVGSGAPIAREPAAAARPAYAATPEHRDDDKAPGHLGGPQATAPQPMPRQAAARTAPAPAARPAPAPHKHR
jgi:hypothetical protein